MFCGSCGRKIKEQAKFCPYCGQPVRTETEQNATPFYKKNFGRGKFDFKASSRSLWEDLFPSGNPSMNWYQFLIWGYLFFVAFFEFITGIRYLISVLRMFMNRFFYGGIITVYFIYILYSFGVAVSAIYVRQRLIHYRTDAPKAFLVWSGVFTVGNILIIVISAALNVYGMTKTQAETLLMWIVGGCLMVLLNYLYFKKRKFMFVH